ncbi:MAG: hypothetical protein KO206_02145 [Methanomicrobiaceae archaeon]|uniref:Uncharacterized protein n=1 Tax=hydrocarbon metagenome TaxID=938273 RepID=A0A0W8FFA8_9ZZZZ|nr:hypothetical protein [Methanomicrobiaceae archaeon]MDD5419061.1 hypothetical protein [Methanomicrobiaceae archaeon]
MSGEVFRSAKGEMNLSYAAFFDRRTKLDELRLIDVQPLPFGLAGRGTPREFRNHGENPSSSPLN